MTWSPTTTTQWSLTNSILMREWLYMYTYYVLTQPLLYSWDVTQGQFLSRVKQFYFLDLLLFPRLKNQV